jgi:hypothetical protein
MYLHVYLQNKYMVLYYENIYHKGYKTLSCNFRVHSYLLGLYEGLHVASESFAQLTLRDVIVLLKMAYEISN